jgi:CHAD domain-containing protein/CYTH domain-containing protein
MPSAPFLPLPAPEAVRQIALSHLDEASAAADRLESGGFVEGDALHDFRVGLRRLRSTLRAYREFVDDSVKGKWRRKLGKLAGATGTSRDAEVQAEWIRSRLADLPEPARTGAERIAEGYEATQAKGYGELRAEVLPAFRALEQKLRRSLAWYSVRVMVGEVGVPLPCAAVCADLLRRHGDELAAALTRVAAAEDDQAAHRARIAAKRVRYLLEPLRSEMPRAVGMVERLKQLQDVLGELHDRHVLLLDLGVGDRSWGMHRALREPGRAPLAALALADARARFAAFQSSWTAEAAAAFFADLASFATELARGASEGVEVERKFLLRALPPRVETASWVDIEQGWIPGDRLNERLRRTSFAGNDFFYRSVKLGAGLRRIEIEEETTREIFTALWPLTAAKRIRKRRYVVPQDDLVWEVDAFAGRDLVVAEVELPLQATSADLPEWLAPYVERDVTEDPAFTNMSLARPEPG